MLKNFSNLILMALALSALSIFSNCSKDKTPDPNALPDTVSFSKNIIPIFTNYCNAAGCHSGGSPAANLNLEPAVAYNSLIAKQEMDTNMPTNSVLYVQMDHATLIMPPAGRLDDYTIGLVLKWIEQGAKDN